MVVVRGVAAGVLWVLDRPIKAVLLPFVVIFGALVVVPDIERELFPVIDDVEVRSVWYADMDTIRYRMTFTRHKSRWCPARVSFRYIFTDRSRPSIPFDGRVYRVVDDDVLRPIRSNEIACFRANEPDRELEVVYQFHLPEDPTPGDRLVGWVGYRGPFPLSYVNDYEFGEVVVPPLPDVPALEFREEIIRRQLRDAQRGPE